MSLLPLAAQTANDVAQQCVDTEIFPLWLRVTHFINFLLMALALYLCIIVPMNALNERMKKQAANDAAEAKKEESDEVKLLTEIRDALAQGGPRH